MQVPAEELRQALPPKHFRVNSRISCDRCVLMHDVTPEWCLSRPVCPPTCMGRDTQGSCLDDTPNATLHTPRVNVRPD